MLPSRRSFLFGGAAALLGSAAPGLAQGVPGGRFSGIAVDVSRLRQLGHGPFADIVQSAMTAELHRLFGGRLGGPGPRLVVVVTALSLNINAGGGQTRRGGGGGNPTSDYLEGEALLVGRRGEILERIPQLLALNSDSGGAYYLPGNEQRRAAALARTYAAWLERRFA